MMTAPVDDAQAIAYLTRLAELEQQPDCAPATLAAGPFTAFTLIGALQLATRHPAMNSTQSGLIRQIIDQLRPLFAGSLGEQLIELGDDPANDMPRELAPVAEITDDEGTVTTVEAKHDLRTRHKVRLVVDASSLSYRSTWLDPDVADHLAGQLRLYAADARRQAAKDAAAGRRITDAAAIDTRMTRQLLGENPRNPNGPIQPPGN